MFFCLGVYGVFLVGYYFLIVQSISSVLLENVAMQRLFASVSVAWNTCVVVSVTIPLLLCTQSQV